ncbi:hypothetical protein, partial [[Clostridium] aminophilum]|uniref:hypothetical protein n=1 Tax=[Clostridium] aminophilum TaxID=1526 RepID=UPI001A9A54A8
MGEPKSACGLCSFIGNFSENPYTTQKKGIRGGTYRAPFWTGKRKRAEEEKIWTALNSVQWSILTGIKRFLRAS